MSIYPTPPVYRIADAQLKHPPPKPAQRSLTASASPLTATRPHPSMTHMSDPEQKTGDQQTDPPSQRRAWAFRLVAMAITVMLGLVCGEVAVRVFNIGPEFANVSRWNFRICDNPVLQYELHPGTTDGHGTRINPDGMRDRAYTVAKPPGTFRIACIGDSICFGTQIEQADTFSSKLEAELNRRFASAPICEVLNFGVAGYDIDQINENLRVRALKYKPDLIIYAYCLNDPEVWNPTFNMLRGGLNQAGKRIPHPADGPQRCPVAALYAESLHVALVCRWRARTARPGESGGITRSGPPRLRRLPRLAPRAPPL